MNRSILFILMAGGIALLLGSAGWSWRTLSSPPVETGAAAFGWMAAAGMLLGGVGMLLIGISGWRQAGMKAGRHV